MSGGHEESGGVSLMELHRRDDNEFEKREAGAAVLIRGLGQYSRYRGSEPDQRTLDIDLDTTKYTIEIRALLYLRIITLAVVMIICILVVWILPVS